MYLAPLNYDRFFKKVFSDLEIAKSFLEDFLDVTIETIEPLSIAHKLTDDAAAIEFDFRCCIQGQYVIIDMQQWFKTDIVKRFYIYFALNSVLQLENIPMKSLDLDNGRKYETRNYDGIEPAITLIWVADETLKFKDDYVAFSVLPEQSVDFLKNDTFWVNPNLSILKTEREKVLSILNNSSKNLDFLPKNRLIYAFQKNIVKNKKFSKYFKWFELAEKSRNKKNKKEDFINFEKDKILMAVINRIRTDNLKAEEFQYIEDYEEFRRQVKIHDEVIRKEGREEGMLLKDYENKFIFVTNLIKNTDFSDEQIASLAGTDVSFVKKIRADLLLK